jgi:hypothetical protein
MNERAPSTVDGRAAERVNGRVDGYTPSVSTDVRPSALMDWRVPDSEVPQTARSSSPSRPLQTAGARAGRACASCQRARTWRRYRGVVGTATEVADGRAAERVKGCATKRVNGHAAEHVAGKPASRNSARG